MAVDIMGAVAEVAITAAEGAALPTVAAAEAAPTVVEAVLTAAVVGTNSRQHNQTPALNVSAGVLFWARSACSAHNFFSSFVFNLPEEILGHFLLRHTEYALWVPSSECDVLYSIGIPNSVSR